MFATIDRTTKKKNRNLTRNIWLMTPLMESLFYFFPFFFLFFDPGKYSHLNPTSFHQRYSQGLVVCAGWLNTVGILVLQKLKKMKTIEDQRINL